MASITTDAATTVGTFLTEPSTTAFSLGAARQIANGMTSADIALTTTCRFVSLALSGGNHCHYQIGVGAQTASWVEWRPGISAAAPREFADRTERGNGTQPSIDLHGLGG